MAHLVNEPARLLSNKQVGLRLYLMVLHAPLIASHVRPGQFVHLLVPSMEAHVLRRPFSIYARDTAVGTVEILYQTVGFGTRHMADLSCDGGAFELIGPVGNTWSLSDGDALVEGGEVADNFTTDNLNCMDLPIGTQLAIGDEVLVEISQIGKVCHTRCAIYYMAGDCIFPREGIFCVVLRGGTVKAGDAIDIVKTGDGTCAFSPDEALAEVEAARQAGTL